MKKEKANFETSGKLLEDTNVFKGVVIKYNEPTEARKPGKLWRLYPFKGDQSLPIIHLHRQSAFMIGSVFVVFFVIFISLLKLFLHFTLKFYCYDYITLMILNFIYPQMPYRKRQKNK